MCVYSLPVSIRASNTEISHETSETPETPELLAHALVSDCRREMIITDAKKRKEGEEVLAVDRFLVMTCHIPPFTTKAFERITVVDPEHHRLAWANIDYPSWALRAERWQVLSTMGNGQTRYESWEAFNGVLAHLVKWVIGRKLEQAFVAFADGLKGRCEG